MKDSFQVFTYVWSCSKTLKETNVSASPQRLPLSQGWIGYTGHICLSINLAQLSPDKHSSILNYGLIE